MACLLVYEQANNTQLDKQVALEEFISKADFAQSSGTSAAESE
eukprot:CAMPEP_0185618612 /NCGR_PEP_ID=MMETSP0436-20130131/47593_1 /TAXON_ID=626734 ORGANISM="Favella taraikaensis, Strain Fe Narragansett Bay" /NCGR_SAMPLE_ID=MMETSP0436 /ASSEMBLY_ACC=CAM_ASM_000390 /LENGTH=42 /DNA_ID= /DNA_START= /DNA_END= /DNA_ORIENTATION=